MFNTYFKPWLLDKDKGETHSEFPWKSTPEEVELMSDKVEELKLAA